MVKRVAQIHIANDISEQEVFSFITKLEYQFKYLITKLEIIYADDSELCSDILRLNQHIAMLNAEILNIRRKLKCSTNLSRSISLKNVLSK